MRRSSVSLAPLALLLALTLAACGNKGPLVYATPAQDIEDIEDDADLADGEDAGEAGGTRSEDEPAVDDADADDADADDGDGSDPEAPVDDAGPVAVPPATDPGHG